MPKRSKWIEPVGLPVPNEFREAIGGHPIVAETLVARGYGSVDAAAAFMQPGRYQPAPAQQLPGVVTAVDRLLQAKSRGTRICVWGDFDVDGQTSTALFVEILRSLDFRVDYHIPNRERESHGVNREHLERIIDGGTQLVITCDTGIGAVEPVEYAGSRGVDIIVTDHHDLPDELPDAVALVNPKFLPNTHAFYELPGVGVAFIVAKCLVEALESDLDINASLDLVALGIVADLAMQVRDVRYLLQLGLERLRATKRVGLQALMAVSGVETPHLSEEQIGFVLGPRMNALGRLSDAAPAVEFLLSPDEEWAARFARRLEALNAERRQLSDAVYASATRMLEREPNPGKRAAIVLHNPAWPAGVVGLVAGRLAEEHRRPVILLTGSERELARGSARSVAGIDISAAIASQAHLLQGFGGHPMAAGLVMQSELMVDFVEGLDRFLRSVAPDGIAGPEIVIDAFLPLEFTSLEIAADLERLAPFGPGNPPLVLASKGLEVVKARTMGSNQEHRIVNVKAANGDPREVVWWNGSSTSLPQGRFDLAYHLRSSSFRGRRQVQIEWIASRSSELPSVTVKAQLLEVADYRFDRSPNATLMGIAGPGKLIWAEGPNPPDTEHCSRYGLKYATDLILWTTPPDLPTLLDALGTVQPQRVHLFLTNPEIRSPGDFLKTLAGMAKFAINQREGKFDLKTAAVALAHPVDAVIIGLELLADMAAMRISAKTEGLFLLSDVPGNKASQTAAEAQLEYLLREVSAFRAFLHKVDADWFRGLGR